MKHKKGAQENMIWTITIPKNVRTTKYSTIFATTHHVRVVKVRSNIYKNKTKKSKVSKVFLNCEGLLKLERRLIKF